MRRMSLLLSAVLATSPVACKRDGDPDSPTRSADAQERANVPADPFHVPALVPANAVAIVAARSPAAFFDTVSGFDPLGNPDVAELAALREEIDGYLETKVGLRMGEANTAVLFAVVDDDSVGAGAVLLGVGGAPQGEPFETIAGHEVVRVGDGVVAARVGEAVVMGQPFAVRASLEGQNAKAGELAQAIEAAGPGVSFAAAVDVTDERMESLGIPEGIDRLMATMDGTTLRVTLDGEPATLQRLNLLAAQGLDLAVAKAEKEKQHALRRDEPAWVVATMLGVYWAKRLRVELTPRIEGQRLIVDARLPTSDPVMLTAVLGMLAAIAVPALTKYMRRSKTSEARVNLAKMFDSAAAYFHEEHVERAALFRERRKSDLAPHRCPEMPGVAKGSSGVTPPLSVNCNDGPGGRCVPTHGPTDKPGHYDISLWTENPVWDGLNFMMEEPHAFHYRFVYQNYPEGYGACQFTAQAFGDLDDDGVFSTFERAGAGDENGINGAAGLYIDNEVE